MRGNHGAPLEKLFQVSGARELAGVGSDGVQLLAEDPVRAEERLDGHRRRDVCGSEQQPEVLEG
jgi:hypothetical protein